MHWCGHTHLQRLCHLIVPSAFTRTNLYSVCAQGQRPWQYLVRISCQDPGATCDAAPRAVSISEIHSSSSLVGLDARATKSEKSWWQCSSRNCSGSVCRTPSIVSRIVSWAAAVRPSFTSRWTVAFLYAHCAGTTAQATIPVWHWQMFRSPRLIWRVMFYRCVRTNCRISTTSTRKGWLLWTCVLFRHLLRRSSACVRRIKSMCNPARKLLRKTRQEPSSPVLELWSRFPRKSISRSLANYVRSMGARIPRMPPRTVAGMRKTERWKPTSMLPRRQVRSPIQLSSRSPSWARNWIS